MTLKLYELQGRDDRRMSPYCWRTRLALAHKGLEAEYVPVQFCEKDKIAFSGQTLVPVLVDGETIVSDSWAIACYLEDTYPDRPSLFGGDVGRAEARFINAWTDRSVHLPLLKLVISDIYSTAAVESDQPYFRESREKRFGARLEDFCDTSEESLAAFRAVLEPLRMTLEAQPYLAGDAPAYADYIVFGTCKFMSLVSPQKLIADDDPIHAWRARMLGLFDGLAASTGAVDAA